MIVCVDFFEFPNVFYSCDVNKLLHFLVLILISNLTYPNQNTIIQPFTINKFVFKTALLDINLLDWNPTINPIHHILSKFQIKLLVSIKFL